MQLQPAGIWNHFNTIVQAEGRIRNNCCTLSTPINAQKMLYHTPLITTRPTTGRQRSERTTPIVNRYLPSNHRSRSLGQSTNLPGFETKQPSSSPCATALTCLTVPVFLLCVLLFRHGSSRQQVATAQPLSGHHHSLFNVKARMHLANRAKRPQLLRHHVAEHALVWETKSGPVEVGE